MRAGQVASVKKEAGGAGYLAVVKGSNGNRYEVEIAFNETGEIAASCNCSAYAPLAYCKHIAAVLLKLRTMRASNRPTKRKS